MPLEILPLERLEQFFLLNLFLEKEIIKICSGQPIEFRPKPKEGNQISSISAESRNCRNRIVLAESAFSRPKVVSFCRKSSNISSEIAVFQAKLSILPKGKFCRKFRPKAEREPFRLTTKNVTAWKMLAVTLMAHFIEAISDVAVTVYFIMKHFHCCLIHVSCLIYHIVHQSIEDNMLTSIPRRSGLPLSPWLHSSSNF